MHCFKLNPTGLVQFLLLCDSVQVILKIQIRDSQHYCYVVQACDSRRNYSTNLFLFVSLIWIVSLSILRNCVIQTLFSEEKFELWDINSQLWERNLNSKIKCQHFYFLFHGGHWTTELQDFQNSEM